MTASTLITDYFGQGLHADRPATPNVPAGCCAFYYETDTTNAFVWSGSAWVPLGISSGGVSVVQVASAAGTAIQSVTMASAPAQNNLLVAFSLGAQGATNTGWTRFGTDAGGYGTSGFYWKVAGASETTTQTPLSGTVNTALAVFEIANGGLAVSWNVSDTGGATSATLGVSGGTSGTNGILIGAVASENNLTAPTAVSNSAGTTTLYAYASGGTRGITPFSVVSFASGADANTITATWASSTQARLVGGWAH